MESSVPLPKQFDPPPTCFPIRVPCSESSPTGSEPIGLQRLTTKTIYGVVVDHADSLHECVANRRSRELETTLLQVAAERIGLGRARRNLPRRVPLIHLRPAANEGPDVCVEASELALHGQKVFRVCDRTIDFEPVSNDTRIPQKAGDAIVSESRDFGRIKAGKRGAIGFTLVENGLPAQARLRSFEREELEQYAIVMNGRAPLGIVIRNRQRRPRPRAASACVTPRTHTDSLLPCIHHFPVE